MFLSAFDPPVIPRFEWVTALLQRLGPGPTRHVLQLVSCAIRHLLSPVQRLRREIGLPASALNPVMEGQFSAQGAIGLYSKVLGEIRPDYPKGTIITVSLGMTARKAASLNSIQTCSNFSTPVQDRLCSLWVV